MATQTRTKYRLRCWYFNKYLDKLGDNNLLTNILITQKLIVLLLMPEAHRLSTIFMFAIDNVTLNDMSVNFLLNKLLKHTKKDRSRGKFEYRAFKDEKFGKEKKYVCFRRSEW